MSQQAGGSTSTLSVHGRSIAPSPQHQHPYGQQPPSSPVHRFHASPTGQGGYAHPLAAFVANVGQGGAGSGAGAGASSPFGASPTMNTGGGSSKLVIQRPQASRPFAAVGSFQHSLHPTAVQASHTLGQHHKEATAAANANANGRSAPRIISSPSHAAANSGNSGSGAQSPASANKLRTSKDRYGTFPRLGSAGPGASSGGVSPSGITRGTSPASPSAHELHSAASTLHPRPRTGSGSGPSKVSGSRLTPPAANRRRIPSRTGSTPDHVEGGVSDLNTSFGDMDLDEVSINNPGSGYNSDTSTRSIDSHASSFPYQPYGQYANGGGNGIDDDVELLDVTEHGTPVHRGGIPPASPQQLRAGAPPPHKMYGLPQTPTLKSGTPVVHAANATHPQLSPSGVRSASRGADNMSSTESSALQSPFLEPVHLASVIPKRNGVHNGSGRSGSGGPGSSPIPTHAADEVMFETKDSPILVFPTPMPVLRMPNAATVVASPPSAHEFHFTTIPPLNLPRATAAMVTAPKDLALVDPVIPSPRSPTAAEAAAAAAAAAGGYGSLTATRSQPQLLLDGLAGGGSSSAFSSARSLAHSTSATSLLSAASASGGGESTARTDPGSGREWQLSSTGNSTARSLTSSLTASASSSTTNLHAQR